MALRFDGATFISLYLPAFILAASNGLVIPALPVLAHSLSSNFALAATAVACLTLGSALAAIPAGYLLDHFGRRRIAILGLGLVAASGLAMTTVTSFTQVIVFQLVAGAGSQMWMLGRLTLLGAQAKTVARGRQVSGMMGMEMTGNLVGPAIGGAITAAFSPAVTFAVRGALCLGAAVLVYWSTRPAPGEPGEAETSPSEKSTLSIWQMLRTEPLPKVMELQLAVSLSRGALLTGTLELYMVYAYGTTASTIGVLRSVISAICVPVTFTAGHLMDRHGRKAVIIPAFILIALAVLVMACCAFFALPFEVFALGVLLALVGQALTSGFMQTLGMDLAPPQWSGRFLGIQRLSTEFGHFLSPMGFALAASTLGYGSAFFCLSAMSGVVATWIAKSRWFPEKVGNRQ